MAETKKFSIQDEFLNTARTKNKELTFYLLNGLPIKAKIKSFDNFTIFVEKEGRNLLIYKHAVSTIAE